MDRTASQYGSGGESGWTLYLDQSSVSKDQHRSFGGFVDDDYGAKGTRIDAEEEDLSMVSDASSGPRHYCEDEDCFGENGCYCSNPSPSELAKKSKNKNKIKENNRNQQHSCLDDTASSPVLGFSKRNFSVSQNEGSMEHVIDFSQGFSATHFKGKSALRKQLGFFQSSLAGKPASEGQGGTQRSKWK